MKKKFAILAGGLMAVALSLVFFTDKPLTAQEALILRNVEAIAQIEFPEVVIRCDKPSRGCGQCHVEEMDIFRAWCEYDGRTIYYCKFC